jgi:SAM-dependent methyltransferase
MPLALQWCQGHGVELGAAAHNPFGLEDCLNVAPRIDYEFFAQSQRDMCGEVAPVDLWGDACHIPVEDEALDYVISSHVIEHLPDVVSAFVEWDRVLKPGGIIFIIFPKRDALPADKDKSLSTIDEFCDAWLDQGPEPYYQGHKWRFTLTTMLGLIAWCRDLLAWEIVATEETDSKVGNGQTVVARKVL